MATTEVENVNTPGRTARVDAEKYAATRAALLAVLPDTAPGLPFDAMKEAAKAHLPEALFPGGKTSGWWCKTVQLDLEAKGLVARTVGKPLRFYCASDADG